ncbi:PREDICTED: protein OBERON 2-like [Tarenaya hassleriana]|uniref:protein OBERON 2-like n=1 Tax=Tarenaya hassleriana TaxID=28532 RepID=UPI00053C1187|nr:PREDICTED: protein OBERON 2-like [Tarenaya hassleriana]XP_010557765.1 PREDICTED: protein OBERON 2-like [Tarenaya hassleriana]XP_010557766.1 PREDICTED: protein OBERON 2-like [Tarenaya hassleriana]
MGTSSGSNHPHQMLPPRQQLRTGGLQAALSLVSSDPRLSHEGHEPRSNSDVVRESPAESASSQETWPTAGALMVKKTANEKTEPDSHEQPVSRHISSADKVSIRDIARERVDIISEKMHRLPDKFLEELKNGLKAILEGNGGLQIDEFMFLQKFVQSRSDLTPKTLIRAHRVQLEILVAINTGIQAFLHPNISLPQTSLIDIFVYKRCRNIACQNQLPADDCTCEICTNRKGFCNLCMCVICNKFDFAVNTCRWIGCDLCSHWTHTDCAIRDGQISMGFSAKTTSGPGEMLFKCRACDRTSELLGWVKDVFQHCSPNWDRESLMKELDFVSRIFRGCEDPRERKLFWKCEELIDKIKGGMAEATATKLILMFFQEIELDTPKSIENEGGERVIAPQDACNRIAEVVQETLRKMEMVAEENVRLFKKARSTLETCDRELEEKAKEVAELKVEKQKKKLQIEELERIVRLKQAEADMFQLKANEAKREAERLQRIVLAKMDKSEEEYVSNYLKLRLSEAEAEKQYLFEKIKLQESSRASHTSGEADPSQVLMYSKIRDLLQGYNLSPKVDPQSNQRHLF